MFCILGMSKPAHVQVQSLCDYISKNCISTSLTCFFEYRTPTEVQERVLKARMD
jgi:hypothetical protein